ncbi:MAG: hypothetical protein F9K31_02555 [Dokdonella sp.]|nr:MAG: hypothetical protein F9K31_02555 [Dokdonella sp.]
MALPDSYPITLGQVCTEFGAPSTTALGSFLRGGSYVPSNAINNVSVPTSKPITLGNLLGACRNLAVSASPTSVSKIIASPGIATTNATTATADGGKGSKTYSWTRVSGDTGLTPTASTSATTAFQGTVGGGNPTSRSAVFKCTVTDSSGSASSNNVSVYIEYSI